MAREGAPDIKSLAGRILATASDPEVIALAGYVLGDESPTRTASQLPERIYLMTKWTEFAKEQPPAGHGAIYVTDGTQISFVRRASLPATEVEKWVLAEPEAQALNLTPQVTRPTHWAVELGGLPTVKDEDRQPNLAQAGGPPPAEPFTEEKPAKRGK